MAEFKLLLSAAFALIVFCFLASAAPVNVTSCMNLSTVDTLYELNQSIEGNQSFGVCLYINVSNVTLDCKNFNVTGNSSSYDGASGSIPGTSKGAWAIANLRNGAGESMVSNITIRNCNVSHYAFGIGLTAENSSIYNINVSDFHFYGLYSGDYSFVNFTNLTFSGGGQQGIHFNGGYNYSGDNLTVLSGGFSLLGTDNSTFSNVTVLSNNRISGDTGFGRGLEIRGGAIGLIFNNSIFGNSSGIAVYVRDSNASFYNSVIYNQSSESTVFLNVTQDGNTVNTSFYNFTLASDDARVRAKWSYFSASAMDLNSSNNIGVDDQHDWMAIPIYDYSGLNSSASFSFPKRGSYCNATQGYGASPYVVDWTSFASESAIFTPSNYLCNYGAETISFSWDSWDYHSIGLSTQSTDYAAPDLSVTAISPHPNRKIFLLNENVSFTISVFNGGTEDQEANVTINYSNGAASSTCSSVSVLSFKNTEINCGVVMINVSSVRITATVANVALETELSNNAKNLTLIGQATNTSDIVRVPDSSPLIAIAVALLASLMLAGAGKRKIKKK